MPHPAIAPWVEAFIAERSSFPNAKYDDQVDQMTQVLNRLRGAVAAPKKYVPPPTAAFQRPTVLGEVSRLTDTERTSAG